MAGSKDTTPEPQSADSGFGPGPSADPASVIPPASAFLLFGGVFLLIAAHGKTRRRRLI